VRAALTGDGDRKQADASRRRALNSLLGTATRILGTAGHAATPANRQRVSHTLEALVAAEPSADEPPPGRLAGDLEPRGFDALASLAASLPPAATGLRRSARAPKKAAGSAPSESRSAGKRLRRAARDDLEERQAEVDNLAREAELADARLDEATRRRLTLAAEADEAQRRARQATKQLAKARRAQTESKAAARKAEAALRRTTSKLETARRSFEEL
jgi:hypothetical protein